MLISDSAQGGEELRHQGLVNFVELIEEDDQMEGCIQIHNGVSRLSKGALSNQLIIGMEGLLVEMLKVACHMLRNRL